MNTFAQKLQRRFGRIDALNSAAISLNNLFFPMILVLAAGERGAEAIVVQFAINCVVSGISELPTGYLSDRIGWRKSMLISQMFHILMNLFVIVLVATKDLNALWFWGSIAMFAVSASLSASFNSGAYQAGFQKWYKDSLSAKGFDAAKAPPLFVASFSKGLILRVGIPLLGAAIAISLRHYGSLNKLGAAGDLYFAGGFVLFMTILNVYITWDMDRILRTVKETQIKGESLRTSVRNIALAINGFIGATRAYAIAHLSVIISVNYIGGEAYALLKDLKASDLQMLIGGSGFICLLTLCVYLFSGLIFPRISSHPKLSSLRWVSPLVISFFGATAAVIMSIDSIAPVYQLTTFFLCTLGIGIFSLALRSEVSSNALDAIPEKYRSSWLSGASMVSLLTFGILGFMSKATGIDGIAPVFMLAGLSVLSLLAGLEGLRSRATDEIGAATSIPAATRTWTGFAAILVLAVMGIGGFRIMKLGSNEPATRAPSIKAELASEHSTPQD